MWSSLCCKSIGFRWCPPWRYPEGRQDALWVSRQLILRTRKWIPRGLLSEVWSCGFVVRRGCLATKQRANNSATKPGRFVLLAVLAQVAQTLYRISNKNKRMYENRQNIRNRFPGKTVHTVKSCPALRQPITMLYLALRIACHHYQLSGIFTNPWSSAITILHFYRHLCEQFDVV